MFDTPYNREVARDVAHLNRQYSQHVGDIGDGAGISGGRKRVQHKRGGEFELEGGNILTSHWAPHWLTGRGEGAEDSECAGVSGGRKRVHHKRGVRKGRGEGAEGGSILDLVKLPLKMLGLGEGSALSGGRKRIYHKRGGILTGGEDEVEGGILTGGRKRVHRKRGGRNDLVRAGMDIANMFYDPVASSPLGQLVGPKVLSAARDVGSDILGNIIGLGRPKKAVHHKKAAGTRASAAQNPWIAHVKKFAAQHGISYREALRNPACKASYH